MPASPIHITRATPLGATLVHTAPRGATFRVWAPAALAVHVVTADLHASRTPGWVPDERDALVPLGDGTWAGFVPGLVDGSPYRFWVTGTGGAGFKRDPYARELGTHPPFPDCDCLVRDPASYPWHDAAWRTPPHRDLVIYQLHIGTFHATGPRGGDARRFRRGTFLDVLERLPSLRALGINAIQPLPMQEFPTRYSMGYNGTDYFSPESDYQVEDPAVLARHLATANALLAAHGATPALTMADLAPGPNQLKCLVDLCHLHGIAVLFDVVYNHAGGDFDDQSLWFFDRRPKHGHPVVNNDESLYFTRHGWAGGLVFDFANPWVRQLLIDNARQLVGEYHGDGLRYDEVTVIDQFGGWGFAQDIAATVRWERPHSLQVAEYWSDRAWRWKAVAPPPDGMGFDAALGDGLRDAIRDAIGATTHGRDAHVPLAAVAAWLHLPHGFPDAAAIVQCIENHDLVYERDDHMEWRPRVARLADPANSRSWYARSRTRAATALLLTAPGIPMLFMGQEILEDRNWSDNPRHAPRTLVRWAGPRRDQAMRDHLACTRDLVHLRRSLAALRGDGVRVLACDEGARVLAFHRWALDGAGPDVVVVASLAEATHWSFAVGMPWPGAWREAFNSDAYESMPNPDVHGNGGRVTADGPPLHGLAQSARLVIPANGVVVLVRD